MSTKILASMVINNLNVPRVNGVHDLACINMSPAAPPICVRLDDDRILREHPKQKRQYTCTDTHIRHMCHPASLWAAGWGNL
jgi:hypothetical protein